MADIRPEERADTDEPRARRSRTGSRTVRMIEGISGSRHDGQPWPAAGGTIEVPDWEADDLVGSRVAVEHGEELEVPWGETVPATPPPGYKATGRAASGEASDWEVATGHPEDPGAEERAAREQHGGRYDEETGLLRHGHPDPRPDSQILAEDYTDEERQAIELGERAAHKAKAAPREERRKDRQEGRVAAGRRRAAEQKSAERYGAEGVAGAPGAEVPRLGDGDGEPAPWPEGVRPDSQVEAEAPVYEGEDLSEEEKAERATRVPGYTREDDGTAHGIGAGRSPSMPAEADVTLSPGQDVKVSAEESGDGSDVPSPGASKQAWVDHAVARGASPDEANAMTKADLMSRFGGRL